MPRGKKVQVEKPEPHPLERYVGKLVAYYDEGWRHGYLEEIVKGKTARIRPIAAFKASVPRCVTVPLVDMKPEQEYNAPPTC